VALVTSGPGVTNAITGIATAYMDSIPMVIVTGQVPTHAIGLDAFQECDTVGITRPIVKHNFLVKDVRDLADVMKKAFHIARSGRPGPVVVDIPKDVSFKKTPYAGYPATVEMRSYNPVRKGHGGQIRKALQLLLTAKRPYIYTGGGVLLSNASAELRTLVDMLGYPCTNTLMGLGAYPASDRKFLGMLGMHGTVEANNAMQNCDVLLAVGARFDDRVIRQSQTLRPERAQDHPYRHRSLQHLQARQGGYSHRRRCERCAAGNDRDDQGKRHQAGRQRVGRLVGHD
jgi:acetolactate synthase-1/2/3 large subunit